MTERGEGGFAPAGDVKVPGLDRPEPEDTGVEGSKGPLPEPQAATQLARQTNKPTPIELARQTHGGMLLKSLDDLLRFSKMIVTAKAAPAGLLANRDDESYARVATAVQMGMEAGLSPMGSLRAVFVINGLPSWRGAAALGIVRNSKKCKPGTLRFGTTGEGPTLEGWCTSWRVGDAAAHSSTFSMADARTADLLSRDPWKKYPRRMVQWRAIGDELSLQFSDVLLGLPLAEDAEGFGELSQAPAPRAPLTLGGPNAGPVASDPMLDEVAPPADAQNVKAWVPEPGPGESALEQEMAYSPDEPLGPAGTIFDDGEATKGDYSGPFPMGDERAEPPADWVSPTEAEPEVPFPDVPALELEPTPDEPPKGRRKR